MWKVEIEEKKKVIREQKLAFHKMEYEKILREKIEIEKKESEDKVVASKANKLNFGAQTVVFKPPVSRWGWAGNGIESEAWDEVQQWEPAKLLFPSAGMLYKELVCTLDRLHPLRSRGVTLSCPINIFLAKTL